MGGGLESRCVGSVYGADGAVVAQHHPHRTLEYINKIASLHQVGISLYFLRKYI